METLVWIGNKSDVEALLERVQADRDARGHYRIEAPEAGMGFLGSRDQVIVESNLVYFVKGQPHRLLYTLRAFEIPELKGTLCLSHPES